MLDVLVLFISFMTNTHGQVVPIHRIQYAEGAGIESGTIYQASEARRSGGVG
jgi:hypothetical protein